MSEHKRIDENTEFHTVPYCGLVAFHGHLLIDGQRVVAMITDRDVADRICDLLDEHGLVDVPDDLTCPWPPPTGAPTS